MSRFQADLQNPDRATAETVEVMMQHVFDSCYGESPYTRLAAIDAVKRFGNPIDGAFWWPKHAIKFVHHQDQLQKWLNEADQLQLLISPERLLAMPRIPLFGETRPQGDCAVFCMLVAAILECHGVDWEFVVLAVDPREPSLYTHVFTRAILDDGTPVGLDASHGPCPGWEVPLVHRFRTQEWRAPRNGFRRVA
jgi:hypothetical protein